MLAAMKGGASSPTGQMAPVTTPNIQTPIVQTATAIPRTTHYNDIYHSAQQGRKVAQEIENLKTSNLLLAENVTHEKLKQEWTKTATATEQERKYNVTADTTLKDNEHDKYKRQQPHIEDEIKARIAANYGSSTHSYSAAALDKARTAGQYSDNARLKDMENFIMDNPRLFPRLQAVGSASNSAHDVLTGISSLLPWKSNSTTTFPNGSSSTTTSTTRRW